MRVLECPKCKAPLENIEQGQTKVICQFCRFTTDIRDTKTLGMSIEVDALYKRGMLLVEFSDWAAALDVFDQALNLAPDNAELYVGRLLAELRLSIESRLSHHRADLNQYASFQKALRFAQPELRERLEGYNEIVQQRLAIKSKENEERTARENERYQKEVEQRVAREKDLAAAELRFRESRKKKNRIRNVVLLIVIGLISTFFLIRHINEINAFRMFTDINYSVSLLNDGTRFNEINDRNFELVNEGSRTYRTRITPLFMSGVYGEGGRISFRFDNDVLERITLTSFTKIDGWNINQITSNYLETRYGVIVDHEQRDNPGRGYTEFFRFILNDVEIEIRRSSLPGNVLDSVTFSRVAQ